ncbi:MAG TPA: hypothetical protein VK797_13540 [Tepidisphaeraceae bacterium]|nr:hypothetical protein [Tepidisphaeraceae bacterium]
MSSMILESEEQRRRRVSAVIRNWVQAQVIDDLIKMARSGELADQWTTVAELNAWLDQRGYWVSHTDLMARFLSLETCEQILAEALETLVSANPDAWIGTGGRYKPAFRDWNAYAADKANLLGRQIPTADRTVLHAGPSGESLLFAHDNYSTDPRAREQVNLLRACLFESGIAELGFGVSDDGRTWVMIVSSQDQAVLNDALLAAWQSGCAAAA